MWLVVYLRLMLMLVMRTEVGMQDSVSKFLSINLSSLQYLWVIMSNAFFMKVCIKFVFYVEKLAIKILVLNLKLFLLILWILLTNLHLSLQMYLLKTNLLKTQTLILSLPMVLGCWLIGRSPPIVMLKTTNLEMLVIIMSITNLKTHQRKCGSPKAT